jgi:diguanylate cyclase (GGDEF)-like protein
MIELAHSVNVRVCCEGVETEEELQVLKELNSDLLQGYLFAKPLTPKELEQKYIEKDSQEYKEREKAEMRYCLLGTSEVMKGEKENVEHQKMTSIVDGMEEIVYVSDSDTYDLFYMNDAGRTLTGTYDYKGRKCYEVLQGRKSPCELCGKCEAKSEEFRVWEIDNEHLKKHFIVKDKQISWSGRNANLTICIDITEKEDVSQKIQERLEFEENIVSVAKLLMTEADRGKAVKEMLALVGEFYDAGRASLFELQASKNVWDMTYEWLAPESSTIMEKAQDIPLDATVKWYEAFCKGEVYRVTDVEQIKENSPQEFYLLNQYHIENVIMAPLWKGSEIVGFISVDNAKKHVTDSTQLQTMAYFLADRLQKEDTKQRLGELLTFHSEDILKITGLGLWSIRINPNGGRNQMFVDKTMMDLLGLKKALAPEECYEHWYNRINDGYFHYVNEAVSEMIDHGKLVELSYTWKHPVKGEVTVRCIGRRVADSDGMICLEGYHRDINGLERKNFMEDEKNVIFEYHENHHTIYFHTERDYIFGDEEREECFPANWISQGIVHPHFAKKFEDVFIDVKGQPELEYEEFLLKTKNGAYDWFYLSTKDLSKDVKDADTMIIILEPASTERAEELQHLRVQDFYKAILNEKVAWMEVDMESRHILNLGGVWGVYREEALNGKCDYLELMMRYKEDLIHPDDKLAYAEFIGVGLESAMKSENHTKKLEYRRLLDGRMQWLEITTHIFKEQYSENMYALLYLKNVDAQKRKELEQETAATRDALTGVFNRAVFKYHVEMHMSENEELEDSTLLLLDIDNFKQINDTYGHEKGDLYIKKISEEIHPFGSAQSLAARQGGDEFVLLLYDYGSIEELMETIRTLEYVQNNTMVRLSDAVTVPLRFSFGYCLLDGSSDYQKLFKDADTKMYENKRMRKEKQNM